MAVSRAWWPIAATVLALAVLNVASNRLLDRALYVPVSIAAAAGLIAFARRVDERSLDDIGLARENVGRGLRWGGVLAAIVFVGYLIGSLIPGTRDLFLDDRVEDLSFAQVLYDALIRVPLGTVLLEEVAFRGVLPAMLIARTRVWIVVAVSSALFGLWHVLPALGLESVNPVADDTVGELPEWITVFASVVSTAFVGVWFWWLRDRSKSLLTPMALHWATNGFAYLFAWWAWNR